MAQNMSFDIKIPEGCSIQFSQEATYENFIGQFQQYCSKILCVIDGTNFHFYDKKTSPPPSNIRFDYKQIRGTITEYYFRDIDTDTLYCVFGREAATIFYPRMNIVDPIIIPESNITLALAEVNKSPPNKKRPPLIQPVKPPMPLFREIQRTESSSRKSSSSGTSQIPTQIVIVDNGVKLTFPNPNYPIEIKTYYPS